MLVYGDQDELAEPEALVARINRRIERIAAMQPGLERHASLSALLVEAGRLLQGIADEAFERLSCDCRTVETDRLGEFLLALAQALCRSWDSRFMELDRLPCLEASPAWPEQVRLRLPEGFAFYAVYPEAYAEAARRVELAAAPLVIGIRSIGTSLGAVVAAATAAPPPVTVRPLGDPSARELAISHSLARELLDGERHYLVVDEGPGQSGSSFGAVASWLEDRGIPPSRVSLLPSHHGAPGAAASKERRRWWQSADREVGDFQDRWSAEFEAWCAELLGRLDEPPLDISGGRWRSLHYPCEADWPATVPAWERRKFLLRIKGEPLLAKFAGLGRTGEEKLALARLLHAEGLAPEPLGLVHGFLVERWHDDAAPIDEGEMPLCEIARYIGTRSRLAGGAARAGAGTRELLSMARRNVTLEFGRRFEHALDAWEPRLDDLERRSVRLRTDNKLSREEWLRVPSGALLKTDALDHHQGHDLVGCQDPAWDAAGAIVEFGMDEPAAADFVRRIGEYAQRPVDRELLRFSRMAYLAFRLGQARLGATMVEASEQRRLDLRGKRYALELQHLLESSSAATRLETPIG
jgi:hypothetical protein